MRVTPTPPARQRIPGTRYFSFAARGLCVLCGLLSVPGAAMNKLEREIRFLKIYSLLLTLVVIVCGFAAFQTAPRHERFAQIDVERLNLIEPDGKIDMVISDIAHFPDPVIGGKTAKRQGAATPGMIFYNQEGDEDGGLIFTGGKNRDGYSAGAALL